MTPEEQETISSIIRCHVERNEKGSMKLVPDPNGPWKIIQRPPINGLVKYFEPVYQEGYDKLGTLL
jgi:hypothetical protein